MSDRELRLAERAWLNEPEDDALLQRFVSDLVRNGVDPVLGLADAAPDAPWAGFLAASVPIHEPAKRRFGRRLFALIHNGTFFHTGIDVYGPDAIDAWGLTDRAGLLDVRPSVVTRAEEGDFSIQNLGGGDIVEHRWRASRQDFARAVDLVLLALTAQPPPQAGSTPKRVVWRGAPYRRDTTGGIVAGSTCPVLIPEDDELTLHPLLVYADGLAQLGPRGALQEFDVFADTLVRGDGITTAAPPFTWLRLPGLGRLKIAGGEPWSWYVEPAERAREASDELDQLRGEPGALQTCRLALTTFQSAERSGAEGLASLRESIRVAYEAIPEHLRLYVGDMDTKDYEVRRILYPEQFEELD